MELEMDELWPCVIAPTYWHQHKLQRAYNHKLKLALEREVFV